MNETHFTMVVFQRHLKTILGGKNSRRGVIVKIADGVSLRLERSEQCSRDRGEIGGGKVPPPEVVEFALFLAKNVALPLVLGIVSSWIYDKIKRNMALSVTINGVTVSGSIEQIKEILEEELRERSLKPQSTKPEKEKIKRKSDAHARHP